jgi:hypothetical protein
MRTEPAKVHVIDNVMQRSDFVQAESLASHHGDDRDEGHCKVAPQLMKLAAQQLGAVEISPEVPTIGSALHRLEQCRPCGFFYKASGCHFESNCHYCHLCPEGELKSRKKAKLAMLRSALAAPSGEEVSVSGAMVRSSTDAHEAPATTASTTALSTRTNVPLAKLVEPALPRRLAVSTPDATAPSCLAERLEALMAHAGNVKVKNTFIEVVADDDDVPQEMMTRRFRRARTEPAATLCTAFAEEPAVSPAVHSRNRARTQHFESPLGVDIEAAGNELLHPLAQPSYSLGSEQHDGGDCRPCAWHHRSDGCRNGAECRHCHLCPEGELKFRRKDKIATIRKERISESSDVR